MPKSQRCQMREARRGKERPEEARRGQERPGETRRGQEEVRKRSGRGKKSPGEPRRGQERPRDPRRAQESPQFVVCMACALARLDANYYRGHRELESRSSLENYTSFNPEQIKTLRSIPPAVFTYSSRRSSNPRFAGGGRHESALDRTSGTGVPNHRTIF